MDYEPVPKRRRTASPPLLQASNSNIPPRIPPPVTKSPAGEDDKTYQQHLERAFADPRFRATLAQIFDKYDGKSAQPDEAIDPTLCGTSTGDSYLAQSDGLVDNDNLPYHLDTRRCEPKDDDAETADYEVGRLNETHGPCDPRAAPPGYMPTFSGGEVHPNFMQSWYGNPFQAPGPYPSPWDGFSGQIPMPNGPMVPNGLPMTTGSWISPDNFVCNPATWPPQAMQPPPVNCQIDPALEISPPAQEKTSNGTSSEEERRKAAQADESTDNCPPEMIVSFDALGRKRRRRLAQPRFSKNGKRLGRPPKPAGAPGVASETAAYDGEGEDEGHGELLDIKNPAGEFCDEDDDTLWNELAEALQLASKATSKKRNRNGTKPPQKGEHSATESDGAIEMDKDSGQAEIMLRKIQQELIDRAVRRSTMAKEHGDDSDAAAEGRRRSGRDRKPANFGEQVSWDKVSAERRTSYKIKMHLRALSVQARQERKKKEKEEAEVAARQKEEAEKAKKEKQEAEKLAAAAAASASGKGTTEEPGESMPSTIPDSQDTVISLPIRTTPKKPQSNQIMRQTIKNHVNSVVHFEEDDEGLSDNDTPTAPAIFPLKNPVLAFKKPEIHVHSFLGENYIDTVYALSDDEAPALLTSMKRVSLTKKQKISRVPVALARPRETFNTEEQDCLEAAEQTVPSGGAERHASEGPASNIPIATNTMLDPQMDTSETTQVPVCKPTELDKSTRPSITIHGDGDDSGIDIRSEQAPSEQAEGPVPTISVPAKPLSQDHDLLGTADILDSLDVMSGTEDSPSSPVSDFAFPTDDIEINDVEAPSTTTSLISSRRTDEPLLVDDDSINESMDIFKDVAADIPLASDEEAEMEYNESLETTTNARRVRDGFRRSCSATSSSKFTRIVVTTPAAAAKHIEAE
ncbi:hypothetical protein V2A60_003441 [Cordyceps javanica]